MLNEMRIFDRARVFDYCLFRDETFDLRGALISRLRVTEYTDDVGYGSLFLCCHFHGERQREKEKERENEFTENFDEMQSHGGVNI